MRSDWSIVPKLLLLGSGVFSLLMLINYLLGYVPDNVGRAAAIFLFCQLYTFCLYFANSEFFCWLEKLWPGRKFSPRRILVGFLGSFVVSLVVVFVLRVAEDLIIDGHTFREFLASETPANYWFAIGVTFLISATAYGVTYYRAWQENRVNEQKLIAGRASAQLESLKNQIDPHFLFNSLNVLSALIEENQKQAVKFTIGLSKVYRYVLEQKDKELVPLREEMEFARTYIALLLTRFENSLEFQEGPGLDDEAVKVVPLSLQLLLENCIKHNVVSAARPLRIEILREGDELVVRNNLQKKEALNDRRGVGLENIASRYAILTRRRVSVSDAGDAFAVRLPLLSRITEAEPEPVAPGAYEKARKRVEDIRNFYGNLLSFVVINGGLLALNLATSPKYLWCLWVIGSWGIGLLFQAAHAFRWLPFLGRNWEEQQIEKYILNKKNDEPDWK